MPQLDYAFLCDFVRAESGLAHVIGAGVDTIYAPEVPTGHNLGLLMRFNFTQGECGRPHRIEVYFRDTDGQDLVKIDAVVTPEWDDSLPAGWPVGVQAPLNFGVPFPEFGVYAFEIMIDDNSVDSRNLRVVERRVEVT
jgi:hypothetical protein